jgi:hypothetical protein
VNNHKIAGILAVCTILGAAAAPAAADAPPAQAKELARFVGTWNGKGKLTMDGKTADVTFTWKCQQGAGGFGVRCDLQMKGIPGMATYDEMDIMGYDPGDGLVHWYSVTSAGETHDHKGSFDGNSFQATFSGPNGGNLYSECNTFKFESDRKFRITSAVFVGQKAGPYFDLTATR